MGDPTLSGTTRVGRPMTTVEATARTAYVVLLFPIARTVVDISE